MKSPSQEQETDVTLALRKIGLDARLQPGSGNKAERPNDIEVRDNFFVECKMTMKGSLSFKLAWFQHMIKKALTHSMRGVLAIRFKDRLRNWDYYVVEAEHFHHLLACEQQLCRK